MKNLHNLIKLDVSDNDIADKEAYEDTESLADKFVPIVSQISHLTTKPITHTAVQYLASVIDHNPNVKELKIEGIDLDSEQTIAIFKGMKNLTKLTQLNISGSVITNNAANLLASILSHNISLQVLDLSSCSLQTEGATEIFNAIRNHSHLISLDISNSDITNDAANVLASVLSLNITVQDLHLQRCSLQTEGAIKIFNAIRNHSCLISLNISNNDITNDAANVLASVLSLNITVQDLHLQRCSLQTEGAIKIFNAIRNHSCLISLNISNNDITNDAANVLASALSCNINLQNLDLRNISLQTEGAIKIFNAIRNHVCLTRLNIANNDDIDGQTVDVLRAVVSSNPRLRCYMPSMIEHLINISK